MKAQPLWLGALIAMAIVGCHDSSDKKSTETSSAPASLSPVPNLKAFETEIKRNLRTIGSLNAVPPGDVVAFNQFSSQVDPISEGDTASSANGTEPPSFSQTNVQETGVDESDRVKFDGRFLFVAKQEVQNWFAPLAIEDGGGVSLYDGSVRILETHSNPPTAVDVGSIALPGRGITGMYLHAAANNGPHTLAIMSYGLMPELSDWYSMSVWGGESNFQVDLQDVTNPLARMATKTISIDGNYLDSRKIDNHLYVISRYFPVIDTFQPYPVDAAVAEHNAAVVDALDVESLVPKISINGGPRQSMVTAEHCLVPGGSLSDVSYLPFIITVTTIDLENPDQVQVNCMVGEATGIYASRDHLYVLGLFGGDSTIVHQFNFTTAGAEYQATGSINGTLGWNNPQLRLSEYEGDLRAVTTDVDGAHHLNVLRPDADHPDQLATIATLPNAAHPEPIGKLGEDLYAVRYVGPLAYVVTFERIDPLYIVDLHDPTAPFIAGSLEATGYSDYLQPLGDHLLLGIGYETAAHDGRVANVGIKIGLFDATHPDAPALLHEEVIGKGGSVSPVSGDYHALSILKDPQNDRYKVVVPAQVHDGLLMFGDPDWGYYAWQSSRFRLFDIDANTNAISSSGDLVVAASTYDAGPESYFYRSVISGENVFAIYGNNVWSSLWSAPADAVGPQ